MTLLSLLLLSLLTAADSLRLCLQSAGYRRVEVPSELVEVLGWQRLPMHAHIFVYVPYRLLHIHPVTADHAVY